MIRAHRGEGLKVTVWEDQFPVGRDKDSVYMFQCWMGTFIAPGEKPTIQMNFFELCLTDEPMKLTHMATVKQGVVLILGTIYKVEITGDDPWAMSNAPQVV